MIFVISRHLKGFNFNLNRLSTVCRHVHKDVAPPITRYSSLLEKGILNSDKDQFQAVLAIQDLYNDLKDYDPLIGQENRAGMKYRYFVKFLKILIRFSGDFFLILYFCPHLEDFDQLFRGFW